MHSPGYAESLYAHLRKVLHDEGGADLVLDFVANKHMIELCERAKEQANARQAREQAE